MVDARHQSPRSTTRRRVQRSAPGPHLHLSPRRILRSPGRRDSRSSRFSIKRRPPRFLVRASPTSCVSFSSDGRGGHTPAGRRRATRRRRQLCDRHQGHRRDTAGSFFLSETTIEPGFPGPPAHRHEQLHDMFYVLDGVLTNRLRDETHEVGPGTFVCVTARRDAHLQQHERRSGSVSQLQHPGGLGELHEGTRGGGQSWATHAGRDRSDRFALRLSSRLRNVSDCRLGHGRRCPSSIRAADARPG